MQQRTHRSIRPEYTHKLIIVLKPSATQDTTITRAQNEAVEKGFTRENNHQNITLMLFSTTPGNEAALKQDIKKALDLSLGSTIQLETVLQRKRLVFVPHFKNPNFMDEVEEVFKRFKAAHRIALYANKYNDKNGVQRGMSPHFTFAKGEWRKVVGTSDYDRQQLVEGLQEFNMEEVECVGLHVVPR